MSTPIYRMDETPVLPELANKVLRLALDEKVSMARLSGLIEKDQALTARILSLANSSFYRRSRTIYTVRDAVVVMGISGVKTMALGLCVLDIFPPVKGSALDHTAFWRHSIASAIYARSMMDLIDDSLAAKAFCAGLLHDIGKIGLTLTQTQAYAGVLKEAEDGDRPLIDIEEELLGTTHAEVGREMLSLWDIPDLYAEVVWSHHAPIKILNDEQLKISGIVHIANILSHMTYMGASGNNYPQKMTNALLKRFSLSSDMLNNLMKTVPGEIDSVCRDIGLGDDTQGLFRLVNRASMRLFGNFISLKEKTSRIEHTNLCSQTLVRLLESMNHAAKVTEVLEGASMLLFDSGMINGFLGGLKRDKINLVYEKTQEDERYFKVSDAELNAIIFSGDYPSGTRLASGVFVYLDTGDNAFDDDQGFISSVIQAITSALRRVSAEDAQSEQKDLLRKALLRSSGETQKARQMYDLLRELVDASLVGLCMLDDSGTICMENEKASQIWNLVGIDDQNIVSGLHTDPGEILKNSIIHRKECDIRWDIPPQTLRFVCTPLQANNQVLVMMWDITSEVREEQRMLSCARMSVVGNLAASMAHNMKSPLGALQGFASIIRDDLKSGRIHVSRGDHDDEDLPEMIDNMVSASGNVLDIVNQLLNLTRKWDSPARQTDLNAFVDQVFHLLQAQADSAGVGLKKEVILSNAFIHAEALKQVITNLVMNAIAASPSKSDVVVRIWADKGDMVFSVMDKGMGMSADKAEKVFEPMYTDWPDKTGMGLGLALAREIVENINGQINVRSKENKGSVFEVRIPEAKQS